MSHRKLAGAALAATIALLGLAPSAHAAWKGLRAFDCEHSRSNWNFDGLYGPFTTRAIRNFQATKGLKKIDGVAGPETYAALGLRYRRTLKCGMGGNDVFLLQQALASNGFWYGGEGETVMAPSARPRPTTKPRPTPRWTEPPILYTPAPYVSPEATPRAVESPMEMPSAMPTAESYEPPSNTPTVELHGGNWMAPLTAGAKAYDYTFQRPTWVGGGTLWFGSFGLGGDVTAFNQTYVDYRDPAGGPYFKQNTMMYDALAKLRFDRGYYEVFGGYRGIGAPNVNFGTLGVAMDRPLFGSWLWLHAKAQGGHDLKSSYFADGRAGLGLRVDPMELQLGFRHFAYQNQSEPMFHLNGPVAEVRLAF